MDGQGRKLQSTGVMWVWFRIWNNVRCYTLMNIPSLNLSKLNQLNFLSESLIFKFRYKNRLRQRATILGREQLSITQKLFFFVPHFSIICYGWGIVRINWTKISFSTNSLIRCVCVKLISVQLLDSHRSPLWDQQYSARLVCELEENVRWLKRTNPAFFKITLW